MSTEYLGELSEEELSRVKGASLGTTTREAWDILAPFINNSRIRYRTPQDLMGDIQTAQRLINALGIERIPSSSETEQPNPAWLLTETRLIQNKPAVDIFDALMGH